MALGICRGAYKLSIKHAFCSTLYCSPKQILLAIDAAEKTFIFRYQLRDLKRRVDRST
jgi:hypothetical protein